MMDLHFKVFGEGEPLVILHGLFGMLDNWQTIGKKLALHHQVFLVDLRNHGRSPHSDVFDYQAMAMDVEEFMLSQWIHKAIVLGHSMGAKVALQLAINQPDMVNRLISVDMGIKRIASNHNTIFNALQAVDINSVRSRKEVDKILSPLVTDVGIRLFLMKNLTRNKRGGYKWKMNLDVIHSNYNEILMPLEVTENFDNPTLFIRGQNSNYIMGEDWPILSKFYTDAQLVTVPDAGHWVHADQPDVLLSEIRKWLGVKT